MQQPLSSIVRAGLQVDVLAQMGMRKRMCQIVPPGRAALWLPVDDSLISGPEAGLRRPDVLLRPDVVGSLVRPMTWGFATLVRHCVRLAVDLGASAVKTVYTGSVESFETVVSAALGIPVLVAGEQLSDTDHAIAKAQAAIRAGAAGVAYGRQVFQRDDPGVFVQKLRRALDDESVSCQRPASVAGADMASRPQAGHVDAGG